MSSRTLSTPCRVCSDAGPKPAHAVPETMFGTGERFEYLECLACGCLLLGDVPPDLARYYARGYYSLQDAGARYRTPWKRWLRYFAGRYAACRQGWFGRFLCWLKPWSVYETLLGLPAGLLSPGLRILDVGCGGGDLVHVLAYAGFDRVLGIDPFAESDVRGPSGPLVRRCGLRDLGDTTWDVVMFHHSLEHVPDPIAELSLARARLAPGGACLVRVPTCSSEAWSRYREYWIQLDAPRHQVIFSRRGLQLAAERTGFRIDLLVDDSTAFQFWGSEQAAAGIALMGPDSEAVRPRLDLAESGRLAAEAERLNREGRGDQVMVLLRPASGPVPDTGPATPAGPHGGAGTPPPSCC